MLRRQQPFRKFLPSFSSISVLPLLSLFSSHLTVSHRFMFPHSRLPASVERVIPKHREKQLTDHARLAAVGLPPSEQVSPLAQEIELLIYKMSIVESGRSSDLPQWIPLQIISKNMSDDQLERLDAYDGGGLKQLIERQLSERCVIVQDSKTGAWKARYVAIKPEIIHLVNHCVTPAIMENGLYRDVMDFGVVSHRVPDELKRWCEKNHGSIAKAIYAGFRRIPFLPWKMDRRKFNKVNPIRFTLKPEHPLVATAMRANAEKVHARSKLFFEMVVHGTNTHFANSKINNQQGGFNRTFESREEREDHEAATQDAELLKAAGYQSTKNNNNSKYTQKNDASDWVLKNCLAAQPGDSLGLQPKQNQGQQQQPPSNNNNLQKTVLDLQREDNERSNTFFKNHAMKKHVVDRPFMGTDFSAGSIPEAPEMGAATRNRYSHHENNTVGEYDSAKKRFLDDEEKEPPQQQQNSTENVSEQQQQQQQQQQEYSSISWSSAQSKSVLQKKELLETAFGVGGGGAKNDNINNNNNNSTMLLDQLREADHKRKVNGPSATSIAFGRNSLERNSATNQEFSDLGPSIMTPFVPSFFVPLEKIEKELEPFGYSGEHFERYFGSASKCFQIISLGGSFGSKPKKFVRMHGHNGDFDMSECLTVASECYKEFKVSSAPEAVEPFLKILQQETTKPGEWMPLGKLLHLVGKELVQKWIPIYITDDEVQKVKETAKTEQVYLALKQAQELSPLLYLSQLLHLFNFSPADGGMICYTAAASKILAEMKKKKNQNNNNNNQQNENENDEEDEQQQFYLNLDQFSTPCPVFVNHLIKGLWNQSVPVNILETLLIPPVIMENLREFYPNWESFADTHSSLFALNTETGYVSLRSHLERQIARASGSLEAELEHARKFRSTKEVNGIRRRHVLEKMPDHPLATTNGLADYLFFMLPEDDWIPYHTFKVNIPMQVLDFMPRKGLYHMVTRFPNHFKIFDLPVPGSSSRERHFASGRETVPCLCRTTFQHLPDGAMTEKSLTERELMRKVCRIFINSGLFGQQRGILLDVLMKRIPYCARIEIRRTEDMLRLLKRLPQHFVLMAAYSDNMEVRLVKKPEEEDLEVYADINLSETGSHMFSGGKYSID